MRRDEMGEKAPGDDAAGGADAIRARVFEWVDANWDSESSLLEWRRKLADSGWACPTWPVQWGGMALPAALGPVVSETLAAAGVPRTPDSVGMHLVVPALLAHASDPLKREFLRKSATGEIVWCQLFSEPGAGSDLAGLTTRADRDGDEWTCKGQKVWNTGAVQAEFGLLLARTDWDAPKHRGITCFVLPMRQKGVEVRPLRQMNGHQSFNEVFIEDARIPSQNVVGEVSDGWSVALTTLAHERRLVLPSTPSAPRDPDGRVWREARQEMIATAEPYKWYPQRAGRVDLLAERAVATGMASDPLVRQEVARVEAMSRAARWSAQRSAAARAAGKPPGPEGSIGKLTTSLIARGASRAHTMITGAAGTLSGPDSPLEGLIAEIFVSVPSQSIAGGTDEIQRNIISERILGLPKEPSAENDMPFRDVPKNG